jgi:HD-GYP domain-containing protein (c-di-GMP phosphodiesterase class II)
MTHDRPYRPAMSLEAALEEIRRGAGRQFDPELAPIFLDLVGSGLTLTRVPVLADDPADDPLDQIASFARLSHGR